MSISNAKFIHVSIAFVRLQTFQIPRKMHDESVKFIYFFLICECVFATRKEIMKIEIFWIVWGTIEVAFSCVQVQTCCDWFDYLNVDDDDGHLRLKRTLTLIVQRESAAHAHTHTCWFSMYSFQSILPIFHFRFSTKFVGFLLSLYGCVCFSLSLSFYFFFLIPNVYTNVNRKKWKCKWHQRITRNYMDMDLV